MRSVRMLVRNGEIAALVSVEESGCGNAIRIVDHEREMTHRRQLADTALEQRPLHEDANTVLAKQPRDQLRLDVVATAVNGDQWGVAGK